MGHLAFELILWLLLAFLIGCILGCLLRKVFGSEAPEQKTTPTSPASEKPAPVADKPESEEQDKKDDESPSAPVSTSVPADEPKRPQGLAGARDGKADNLQRISGVGPKLEKTLNSLGFYHFDQIANWSAGEVTWVDEHLRFKGRIARDRWQDQASLLAKGDDDAYEAEFGKGKKK